MKIPPTERATILIGGGIAAGIAGFLLLSALQTKEQSPLPLVAGNTQAEQLAALDYLSNNRRNEELGTLAHNFGVAMLAAYDKHDNTVGPITLTCRQPGELPQVATPPTPPVVHSLNGEWCTFSHDPATGGSKLRLDLEVGIDNAGRFDLGRISWLGVNNQAELDDPGISKQNIVFNRLGSDWVTNAFFDGSGHYADMQSSKGAVEFVDNFAGGYLQQVTARIS